MKYFITETERRNSGETCYHEFYKGDWNNEKCIYWNEDSLSIHEDNMDTLQLYTLISKVVPYYNYYGETRIDENQWKEIYLLAKKQSGELFCAIREVSPWVEENFKEYSVFTILGL